MLKFLTALSAAALVISIPQIASSQTPNETSGYPAVPNSQADSLICYMQTPEGSTLNLKSLCGEARLAENATNSGGVSSAAGKGNCDYFGPTDSKGKLCSNTAASVGTGESLAFKDNSSEIVRVQVSF